MLVTLWLQALITWYPAGRIKYYFRLEVIIKGINLGKILEPNSSMYCFIISINWSLHSLMFKSSCQLLPCDILFKTVMSNLLQEVPRFCLVIFLILSILYVYLINPSSFIVINLSGNMSLIRVEIHSLKYIFAFKHLIKVILSINLAASSGGVVCKTFDSLMI